MTNPTDDAAHSSCGVRVLMCGDRRWDDPLIVSWLVRGIAHGPGTPMIIEGGAKGADTYAGRSADRQGVQHLHYPANWDDHGRAAGPIRNQQMLTEGKPDVVIAFHDDLASSKGTRDMVTRAHKAGVPVYVVGRYGRDPSLFPAAPGAGDTRRGAEKDAPMNERGASDEATRTTPDTLWQRADSEHPDDDIARRVRYHHLMVEHGYTHAAAPGSTAATPTDHGPA